MFFCSWKCLCSLHLGLQTKLNYSTHILSQLRKSLSIPNVLHDSRFKTDLHVPPKTSCVLTRPGPYNQERRAPRELYTLPGTTNCRHHKAFIAEKICAVCWWAIRTNFAIALQRQISRKVGALRLGYAMSPLSGLTATV